MKPSHAIEVLSVFINAKMPVLLTGAPGVGKTDIVKQVSKNTGFDLLILHPVVDEPTDYKGLPFKVTDGSGQAYAEFLTYGNLKKICQADKPLIVFFDDLGQADVSVQKALMQVIYAREINGQKISDHVVFIGATNRKQDRAGVSGMIEPLKSRFHSIIEIGVDVDDWCKWALANNKPIPLVAFVRFKSKFLTEGFVPTADMTNSPCPRTIANLGDLMQLKYPSVECKKDVYKGAVGEAMAIEVLAFEEVFTKLPSPDAILMNPDAAPVPSEPSVKYAICGTLARKASDSNFDRIITYANRLPPEYGAVLVKDCLSRVPVLQSTAPFVTYSTKHAELFG